MLEAAESPSTSRNSKLKPALWQSGVLLFAALALGLGVNSLRSGSDRLPLVGDWSIEAQLTAARPEGDTLIISLQEAQAIFETPGVVFVDSRPEQFYRLGHIQGALSLPWDDFDVRFEDVMREIPRDTLIIAYCDGDQCSLSKDLALALLGKGFADVRVLLNGWSIWNEAGLPTETAESAAESG